MLGDARGRVQRGIANIAVVVVYPGALRTGATLDVRALSDVQAAGLAAAYDALCDWELLSWPVIRRGERLTKH